jgi:hypothetical protein
MRTLARTRMGPARTWERGDAPLNLLVLGVVLHGYTLPLVFLGRTDAAGHACPLDRPRARWQQWNCWPCRARVSTVEGPSSVSLEGPDG